MTYTDLTVSSSADDLNPAEKEAAIGYLDTRIAILVPRLKTAFVQKVDSIALEHILNSEIEHRKPDAIAKLVKAFTLDELNALKQPNSLPYRAESATDTLVNEAVHDASLILRDLFGKKDQTVSDYPAPRNALEKKVDQDLIHIAKQVIDGTIYQAQLVTESRQVLPQASEMFKSVSEPWREKELEAQLILKYRERMVTLLSDKFNEKELAELTDAEKNATFNRAREVSDGLAKNMQYAAIKFITSCTFNTL